MPPLKPRARAVICQRSAPNCSPKRLRSPCWEAPEQQHTPQLLQRLAACRDNRLHARSCLCAVEHQLLAQAGENPRKLGTHFSLGIPTVPLSEMGIPTQRADRTHGHAARGRQLGGTRRTSTGTGVAPPSSAGTRGRGVTGLESWCLEA